MFPNWAPYLNEITHHVFNILYWCHGTFICWCGQFFALYVTILLVITSVSYLTIAGWCQPQLTTQMNHNTYCYTSIRNMVQTQTITVYPKKYAHGFVVLCFVVVMQSFIMNSHEVFIHIHQGCFAGTGAIVRLSQCQWSKPDGYGKISQCITTTKHSKAKTVCIFLGIYCIYIYICIYICVCVCFGKL